MNVLTQGRKYGRRRERNGPVALPADADLRLLTRVRPRLGEWDRLAASRLKVGSVNH